MLFRSLRFRAPASLFLLFGLVTQPIDCQKAWESPASPVTSTAAAGKSGRLVSFGRDGLTISNRDRFRQVRIHGYLGADGRLFAANLEDRQHNVLIFRRVRPLVDGKIAKNVSFRFMPDFGEGKAEIQEVYVEWDPLSAAHLTVGKFKTPIGLEVLRSDRDLTFSERSLASDLLPLRDLGLQVDGSFLQGIATYDLGYFSGAADGTNAGFEWRGTNEAVARVIFQPFAASTRTAFQHLGVGIAVSGGHSHGDLSSFKTIGQQTFFRYASGTIADGRHKRASPQAYFYCRSFEFLAESVISGQTVATGADHRYLSNRGWNISGSWVLTGEKNSYDGIQPAHAFEPSAGLHHLGAWQIAFRHSALGVDPTAFPLYAAPSDSARQARETAVGLNWYVNRYTKIMADYEYTSLQMIANSIPSLCPERVVMTRLQFAF